MDSGSVSIELPGAGIRPWEQLLRDVRELEMSFDARIAQYMQFVQPAGAAGGRMDRQRCAQLEAEVATVLGDLDAVVREMAETVQHQRGSRRVLERHQGMYSDYAREFQRYQANVKAALAREELAAGGSTTAARAGGVADRDRLAGERAHIEQAHTDIDMVLDQAFSVRHELGEQRSMLGGATARLVGVSERIPGINVLLGRIRSRKRKEKVVLAIVMALCICILLFVAT
ncbi:protein transport protein gos1 [Coemansia javaensis]|uniref:Protein transport protein gos1 n=1 Tax=Coemansia javaensis TaxID=2761396 RepID=A0A9W8H2R9_9FUNG|nr:protein transport protein gos1 [Coemansia javaensis]